MKTMRWSMLALLGISLVVFPGCAGVESGLVDSEDHEIARTALLDRITRPNTSEGRGSEPQDTSVHVASAQESIPRNVRTASFNAEEGVETTAPEPTSDELAPIPPPDSFEPRTIEEAINLQGSGDSTWGAPQPTELNMTGALAIVGGQSPQIAFATARYHEAYARLQAAQTLWLPSIRVGVSYNHHEGPLQASGGEVIDTSRSAFNSGLGVQSVGAGSPVVPGVVAQFHAADAVFQPRIADYSTSARYMASEAVTNDTLLETALAYLNLLEAAQIKRIAEETLQRAEQLAKLTASFASTGQGNQADADRARTELVRRQNDVSRADEAQKVAAARLAELLSLDPTIEIMPQEISVAPIDLVPEGQPMSELVATGLSNRPELSEAEYLVCEAVNRYRREKFAPLLPSALLGISQSGFGGGRGSKIDRYSGRLDVDAVVYWELRNLGFGERAKRNETAAICEQAEARQVQILDRVAREVVEAATQVESRKSQIETAQSGVQAATDSYTRDMARIRDAQGLPIEVLQSLRALDDAQREYLRTVVDYNEAQFRLQRALGWPIQ